MALTAHTFTKFQDSLANKLVNMATDSLYVMLLSAYTPAVDTHQYLADVLGAGTQVANGNGYTTNGNALSGVSISDSGHVTTLTCTNPSWSTATFTAAFAVFYDRTPATDATRPVFVYWDFGGSVAGSGGNYTLTISGSGLLTLTGTG